jgi:hypothetical protein
MAIKTSCRSYRGTPTIGRLSGWEIEIAGERQVILSIHLSLRFHVYVYGDFSMHLIVLLNFSTRSLLFSALPVPKRLFGTGPYLGVLLRERIPPSILNDTLFGLPPNTDIGSPEFYLFASHRSSANSLS